ncbi:MAG TPA: DUF3616 domain-containing protein [Longimicrobium sp.]|jgi:hypothetical protein|uniref:DUF3616 domain-containing protein n=1 Tax=Longimicrobium sp. TaxID=2029185 RepID=UPI002ED84530
MSEPQSNVRIALTRPPEGDLEARDIRESLSAVVQTGPHLWLGCDETATLERVTDHGAGRYAEHRTYRLADVLDLPGDDDAEVDVEGLAWAPPYLWMVGSHGRKRGKPDPDEGVEKAFAALADVDEDENRYLLARIPLEEDAEGGGLVPRRSCADPRDPSSTLTSARLRGKGQRSALMRAVREDEHLRRYLKLPGKDNGFDVEGLAAAGGRLFLGLRGPVVRGWAVVLEVEPVPTDRPERLKLKKIGPEGRRYRKHFLDLDGLGVREITADGDDLLVLAGPTMGVRAPATLFRWPGAVKLEADSITARDTLEKLLDLPHDVDGGADHPEGICCLEDFGGRTREVLVVYDSGGPRRQDGDAVVADVFRVRRGRGPGLMETLFPPRHGGDGERNGGGEGG